MRNEEWGEVLSYQNFELRNFASRFSLLSRFPFACLFFPASNSSFSIPNFPSFIPHSKFHIPHVAEAGWVWWSDGRVGVWR